ncbi:MAG: peptide chain release factor H [Clostridiales bacterium]|jgi:peptide chain release factor|nr:peptide chain release factor H [Clostridiales bacterium]
MLYHITAGRGPAECELAVGRFLAVLAAETDVEVLAKAEGRYAGCLKSALVRAGINGPPLQGTVQWICRSPFRPNHKRKNWFIGVNRMDEPKDCGYEIGGGGGVVFQTFGASGKGGQHVNKTESAVRAIHIATGLTATASGERSQHQNKKTAVERLNELLRQREDSRDLSEKGALFFNHNNLSRGSPARIYEGIGFKRITGDTT